MNKEQVQVRLVSLSVRSKGLFPTLQVPFERLWGLGVSPDHAVPESHHQHLPRTGFQPGWEHPFTMAGASLKVGTGAGFHGFKPATGITEIKPVILALWEAKVGGSLKVRSLRRAWPT